MPGQDTPATVDQVQEQVRDVMSVMQENMAAMAEREAELGSLNERTEDLRGTSIAFGKESRRLRQNYEWRKYKLYIALASVVIWLLAFLLLDDYRIYLILGALIVLGVATLVSAVTSQARPEPMQSVEAQQGRFARTPLE
eukprot:CAMPEP_0194544340 /NCGR_PEP_ID=MMETSP0253-20130528/87391_1 /TAXON_ID=2966 /ORGANISM="Noctiluca scintillans" /LENGTH=139 /DNA_ID=CAMNT_0039391219 /DNA_START=71 /DNA_END=490 /DNA_ORIENTATION=-